MAGSPLLSLEVSGAGDQQPVAGVQPARGRRRRQTERLALVGRFARSIVHDLKNPLNIIGISAEMAGMEKSTPELRRLTRVRIAKQVERISEMVNEIMEFTQGSQTAFVSATTDYDVFVNQLLDEIRPEIDLKSCTIEIDTPPPPVRLLLDPKRLRRVFYNLIHNATDAMPGRRQDPAALPRVEGKQMVTEIEGTAGRGSRRKSRGSFSARSRRSAKRTGRGWDYPFASASWRTITGRFRREITPDGAARCSFFCCPSPSRRRSLLPLRA